MDLKSLLKNAEFDRVKAAVAAGQTDVTSDAVDTQGYEGVVFVALLGAATATTAVKMHAEGSSDDGSADAYADLAGTEVGTADGDDDDKMLILEVLEPRERYVRAIVTRATADCAVDGILAIKIRPKKFPVTQGSDVVASESHVGPAEGTK